MIKIMILLRIIMKGIINKNKMIRNFLGKSRKKNLNRNRLNRNNVVCV